MRAKTLFSIARAKLLQTPIPVAVGFEITHLCNLSCGYCDRHSRLPDEMSFEQIRSALEGLIELGMQEISLDGGEPLAHPHIGAVVEQLVQRGVVVRMNSNGILVARRRSVVQRLQKLKISLDGPEPIHDGARGHRAFARAIEGALFARDLGVPVEFTCVVGQHNYGSIDDLVELVARLGFGVIFQPARESLFLEPFSHGLVQLSGSAEKARAARGPGARFKLDAQQVRAAFARVEHHKQQGAPILNGWASLRHFRSFPNDTPLPCAAGWINLTLDPRGNLYHCGQVNRDEQRHNVIELGVAEAFRRLTRTGCEQCWCARVVEENYAWGGRIDRALPPLSLSP